MRNTKQQPEPMTPKGTELPIERISPRPSLHFVHEQGSLRALAESIRVQGLSKPVIVRRMSMGRYMILSGNRRLMACRMLGMTHISARILAGDLRDQPVNQLMDALITRRLHYLEAAKAMQVLNERHGMTRGALANMLGLHPQALSEQIRLTMLDEELQAFLMDEGIPLCIALTLLRLPDAATRMSVASRIAREQLCVRDAVLITMATLTRRKTECENERGTYREQSAAKGRVVNESQNITGRIIGVMRDRRLYLNAIRSIAGQLRMAGVDAVFTEQRCGGRLELTVSVPMRRRRAERYQSM